MDDSTVSQPNLKNTVKCVALAIYYHIKNRTSERQIEIFDEKLHPLTVSFEQGSSLLFIYVNYVNKQIFYFNY